MMNIWGYVELEYRDIAASAVIGNAKTATLLPPIRDAILILGGRKWLETH